LREKKGEKGSKGRSIGIDLGTLGKGRGPSPRGDEKNEKGGEAATKKRRAALNVVVSNAQGGKTRKLFSSSTEGRGGKKREPGGVQNQGL